MTVEDREKEFYRNLLNRRGIDDARRFGWTNGHTQATRFVQIIKLIKHICEAKQRDPASVSILDFGCGDGLLFSFMHKMGVGSNYYGYDAIEQHIDDAITRAAKDDMPAMFFNSTWNGEDHLPMSTKVDFIVESGVFSTTKPEMRSTMLKKLFDMPKMGFAGTFVTNSRIIKAVNPNIHLIAPKDIVEIIDETVYAFVLWADYLEADFAVGVYKR